MIKDIARAKINLTLHVAGRRADGYHELQSLVVFADIGDVLTLDAAHPHRCTISGPFGSGPFGSEIGGNNLVDTALDILARRHPKLQLGAVHLQKMLPLSAGIGGGSADAAAVLRLIKSVNQRDASLPDVDWPGIALELGADVPVCLTSAPAMMSGIGAHVEPLRAFPELSAVLANPMVAMPPDKTRRIFELLAAPALDKDEPHRLNSQLSFDQDQALAYIAEGDNDLQNACIAVAPVVKDVMGALMATDHCHLARMSGAGPTCFGLFDSIETARDGAHELSRAHPEWWIKPVGLSGV